MGLNQNIYIERMNGKNIFNRNVKIPYKDMENGSVLIAKIVNITKKLTEVIYGPPVAMTGKVLIFYYNTIN